MERIRTIHFPSARPICSVNISKDGKVIAAGSYNGIVGICDFESGKIVDKTSSSSLAVKSIVLSANGQIVIYASENGTIQIYDRAHRKHRVTLRGHAAGVISLALSHNEGTLVSGSHDKTIRLWDLAQRRCVAILEGHTQRIFSLAIARDDTTIVSGSSDKTIRVWNIKSRRSLAVLRGHTKSIRSIRISPDDNWIVSSSVDGTVRVWQMPSGMSNLRKHLSHTDLVSSPVNTLSADPKESMLDAVIDVKSRIQVQYTNAKVLLVGDSGVGKTGLSNYLAHGIKVEEDKPIPSTDGAWATHWPMQHDQSMGEVEREIWLWDFAGQVDYRLVHQLFMEDTAAAVLVFNPQNENPFEGIGTWDRDLKKATKKPFAKLLVAGRTDRGGLVVSAASMNKFMAERSFLEPFFETSAKTGVGCDELRKAIIQAIDWDTIPETTSPALYQRMKQEILALRDSKLTLIRIAELKQRMDLALNGELFDIDELEAVIDLLTGPGIIKRLSFGGFILLQPELLSRYAAAVVRKVRTHPQELGCIREDELLSGELDYQDLKRLSHEDEYVVLRTLLETFISRAWCIRQHCDGAALLTFPSYFRRERKDQPSHPHILVTYRFDGNADDIYATLVVRLHHTIAFQTSDLWRSAADFETQTGTKLGFSLMRETEGTSLLNIYFEKDVDEISRVIFLRYIHDHLIEHGQNVRRLRHYCCGNKKCKYFQSPFKDREAIDEALEPDGAGKVYCSKCGTPIILRDMIEQKFDSIQMMGKSRELENESQIVIDNESRELILVGHAYCIVAEAGQIYRGYTNSDHGIDGEIEFKDGLGNASGRRLYVQLKSGDSYLKKRRNDGAEIFQIKNLRWAEYWQQQAYAVMLVIRKSDGEIHWMDVTAYLKREDTTGKSLKQVVFSGEKFDVMSVRRWREIILSKTQ